MASKKIAMYVEKKYELEAIRDEKFIRPLIETSREEIEKYEEERRLFYVGVTRAKNNLYLFKTQETSSFVKQFIYKKQTGINTKKSIGIKKIKVSGNYSETEQKKTKYSEEEFQKYVSDLAEGLLVIHKKYGPGVITSMDENNVTILFGEQEKSFHLKILFQNRLLVFPD